MLNQVVTAKDRNVELIEMDVPKIEKGHLLLETEYSAISPGTECLLIRSSDQGLRHLGYSAVGKVIEVSPDMTGFSVGDRVACYGAPYVKHANYLLVPKNLCAKVPDEVDPKSAALAGLGAIAIHALRQSDIRFGESVFVAGLGVLGQIIAQIGNAAAYQVCGFDVLEQRSRMLHQFTAIPTFHEQKDLTSFIQWMTDGRGVDHAILCANGKDTSLIDESLDLLCDRGVVNIVGDLDLNFSREKMFAKEARMLISRAGGPGRYDMSYEKGGVDYPYGYVRWTEGRNMAEYLRLVKNLRIDMSPYTTDVVCLKDLSEAYKEIQEKRSFSLTKLIQF
ncbi:zinc-binding alcohol dehydrogenase [Pseudalkalibacillus sp. SCS-8]|uniref:zinc-dependent alcohol dehydrogenase n=1 Tax=Pseudalkalibacillus nanhaiensis TaxID=3115291 RepID=UPI0032DAFE9F